MTPEQNFTRLSERPFNSEHKYMAISGVHAPSSTAYMNVPPREMYYIKGSIDAILDRCRFYYVSEDSTPGLDANTRSVILNRAQATASAGLRVIAMAYGHGPVEPVAKSSPSPNPSSPPTRPSTPEKGLEKNNLIFVGFQAMLDPPRKGVADAIGLLQSGGVQVVMITGDAEQTALSIAQKLGLRISRPGSLGASGGTSSCLTGKAIDLMTKAQLRERVGAVSVFARTTPRHKMAIIEAFQSRGAVVAMTGDGGMSLLLVIVPALDLMFCLLEQLMMHLRSRWQISAYRWARVVQMLRKKLRTSFLLTTISAQFCLP